ncbi:transposase [Streptomyces misionensis]|uniref:transposase n=1 Tax=Streptomyces misionensis TaxID=67331 RepID=UPI0037DA0028
MRAYPHKKRTSPQPVTARPPFLRTVDGWILRHPDPLTEPERLQLKAVRTHCPELDALARHVRSFAVMLIDRQGERLPDWLDAVRQDDLPSLHTLAAGIERDRDAVIAGLTLPWNFGVVEGHVNRIKMLKRQMFGRAGFRLLRKRPTVALISRLAGQSRELCETAVLNRRMSYSVQQSEISTPTSLLHRAQSKFGPLSPSRRQHP